MHNKQAERGIGDLLVEHVGRVGDDDAVGAGPFGVDMVIADAEARHDLELGQPLHEVGADLFGGVGDGERPHAIGHLGEERVAVLDVVEHVNIEGRREAIDEELLLGPDHDEIGLVARHDVLLDHLTIITVIARLDRAIQ